MVVFVAGEVFDSFADLQQKLADYSEEHFCHFYIKDSKKLAPEEIVNPHLIYKHIVYSCIYGGQKPRFRGSGSRSVTSIRHGCTASLYLRVTKDRNHLQVRSFVEEHNHEVSEELYRSAAQDKKLPWDLKAEVEELLLLGADKDRLVEYIRHVTKKNLDKKNLFNMYETAVKQQREISKERALMLLQKVYGVDTDEEADQILQQLLETSKPSRRGRKEQEVVENIQYTFVNEDDSQEGGDVEQLQRLMGTLSNSDGERFVIVQGDEQYEVIDTDNAVAEYLEEEEKDEVIVKQEVNRDDDNNGTEGTGTRYITYKDAQRTVPTTRKRQPVPNKVVYEPPTKTRIISNQYTEAEDTIVNELDLGEDGRDLKMANLRAEQEKLIAETEVLKLKRNKVVRDISKLDLEKNKLYQEIDLIKLSKKYLTEKTNWLANDLQTKELKNEKLRLEIAKLKFEINEN